MIKLTLIDPMGEKHELESSIGNSLMELAVNNDVPGINADCGGACACATCHIILPSSLYKNLGEPDEEERDLLDFVDNKEPTSRLACQVNITATMEGIEIIIPEE